MVPEGRSERLRDYSPWRRSAEWSWRDMDHDRLAPLSGVPQSLNQLPDSFLASAIWMT